MTDKNSYLTSVILIKDIKRAIPVGYKVQFRELILQCVNYLYFVDKSKQKKQIGQQAWLRAWLRG